jgi:hypothetical protein
VLAVEAAASSKQTLTQTGASWPAPGSALLCVKLLEWIRLRSDTIVMRVAKMFIFCRRKFSNGLGSGYSLETAQANYICRHVPVILPHETGVYHGLTSFTNAG